MNTELIKPETNDKIVSLINTMVPKAHQESAKLLMEENGKKDKYILDLEQKLKDNNKLYSDTCTELEKINNEIAGNELKVKQIETKENELQERESKILLRETNQNHHDEISKMQVSAAKSQQAVITDVLHTIFKPPALRTSIHKTIPIKESTYTQEYTSGGLDGSGAGTKHYKTGETHIDKTTTEDTTTEEE